MDGIKNKTQKHTPNHLPHDIIENILSRLPVKSLLRLKGVCRQWKATISDPKFREAHLRRSNNASCPRLLAYKVGAGAANSRPQLVDFENNGFRVLSAVDYTPLIERVLCHCDGIYLFSCVDGRRKGVYLLCNPSNRTYKELQYPYAGIADHFGICYDPLVKDYKVVIGDYNRYAVFYCKTNSWSEIREINASSSCSAPYSNVIPFSVSFYWRFHFVNEGDDDIKIGVVRFDGRDEKFRIVRTPDCVGFVDFISSGDRLCLFPSYGTLTMRREIMILKKVGHGDEWIKLKVGPNMIPLCWTHENKIIVKVDFYPKYLLVYNESTTTLEKIQNNSDLRRSRLFPYVENLFLL